MKTIALGFSLLCSVAAMLGWSVQAHAGQVMMACTVSEVATFDNRIHIHCPPPTPACALTPGGCATTVGGGPCGPTSSGSCKSQIPPTYVAVEATTPMEATAIQ